MKKISRRSAGLLLVPLLLGVLGGAVACSKSKDKTAKGAKLESFETVLGKLSVPPGNPQTPAKIELGKLLFFDPRLSGNKQISCATCHDPAKGFTTPVARFLGPKGDLGRNTPTAW